VRIDPEIHSHIYQHSVRPEKHNDCVGGHAVFIDIEFLVPPCVDQQVLGQTRAGATASGRGPAPDPVDDDQAVDHGGRVAA